MSIRPWDGKVTKRSKAEVAANLLRASSDSRATIQQLRQGGYTEHDIQGARKIIADERPFRKFFRELYDNIQLAHWRTEREQEQERYRRQAIDDAMAAASFNILTAPIWIPYRLIRYGSIERPKK